MFRAKASANGTSSEADVPHDPWPFRPDEGRLGVDRLLGRLEQLPQQVGPPGPAIRRARDRRLAVAVERDLLHGDEPASGERELPAFRVGERAWVEIVADVGQRQDQPFAHLTWRCGALAGA